MENIIKHKNENDELIFEINKKTKQGKYYIVISDGQSKYVEGPIKLEGFDRLPSGFYKEGFGRIGNINALLTTRRKYHCGSILIESEISRILES